MGMGELAIIIIVALLVLKPKHYSEVAYHVGCWIRYFRNVYLALKHELWEPSHHVNQPKE